MYQPRLSFVLLLFASLAFVAMAGASTVAKRETRLAARAAPEFNLDDLDFEDSDATYRNLALGRLVKKALEVAHAEPLPGAGRLAARSGSKAAQLSALWKTRVG